MLCLILIIYQMFATTQKINSLVKTIVYNTKKSRKTTTPKPFNNPHLSKLGVLTKQPRSYNYTIPENLPNRHLYWNRAEQNKIFRKRYKQLRFQKLRINPIHKEGKKLPPRQLPQLISQLTSINIIRQSVGRTLVNLHEAITQHKEQFLTPGREFQVLQYAMKQVHDRHLPTLNFYKFSSYCQLRFMARIPPTQSLLLHFFRHLQAVKQNKSSKLSFQRFGQLSRYIFQIAYPGCEQILHKKEIKFELFGDGQETFTTFEDIVPGLFSQQELGQAKGRMDQRKYQSCIKAIKKVPGGKKLLQKIYPST